MEALHSLHSIAAGGLTHTNVDQLIATQSRGLLKRVELILFICGACALVCGAFTVATVKANVQQIEIQNKELNLLSWRLSQEHEVVARRFSHEIHDEFGQMLTSMRILLQKASPEQFEDRRAECISLIDEAIGNVRELSQLLRPVVLDDFGLNEALQGMARRLEMQTGIQIRYTSNFVERLPEHIETQFFRIAQEACTNMVRHSKATKASVQLFQKADWITLSIEDNGIGFPSSDISPPLRKGMGIIGMNARIRHLGGLMKTENNPHGGAHLFFSVPIIPTSDTTQLEVHDV